jgi:hypothetical protein
VPAETEDRDPTSIHVSFANAPEITLFYPLFTEWARRLEVTAEAELR